MIDLISQLIVNYGIIIIFIFMMTNGFFSAPPSELTLALAGLFALNTNYSFFQIFLVAIMGNIVGTYFLFMIGRKIGYLWLFDFKSFLEKKYYKASKFIPQRETIFKIEEKLNSNQGLIWIGIFRCLPVVRSIVSLPAGMIKIPHLLFLLYSSIGISIWAMFWMSIGYLIGDSWQKFSTPISMTLFIILLIVLYYFKKVLSSIWK